LSDGWGSLVRLSLSHLTTASSSLACSTVPNSPVGFPKSPKPSTRSPGFSSWSVAEGSESGGLLARSESGVAPGRDRGGCGALCSLGLLLLVIWIIFHCFFTKEARAASFAATVHLLEIYSIRLESMVRLFHTAQFSQLIWLNAVAQVVVGLMQTAQRKRLQRSSPPSAKRFRSCSFGQRLAASAVLRCSSPCTVRMPDPEKATVPFPSAISRTEQRILGTYADLA
jgi:hypothetical protein